MTRQPKAVADRVNDKDQKNKEVRDNQ
jgi:hypothetical protein